jgi:hypothetical protein
MRSAFTVLTPAVDPNLLSLSQIRQCAGLAPNDDSFDADLIALNARVTADIAAACNIRGDGGNPPTLCRETIREMFRQRRGDDVIFLSRRFVSSISSVTEDGTLLVAGDTELDAEAGMLSRRSGYRDIAWRRGEVVIEYVAGFEVVPGDLVGAAMDLARVRLSADSTDPLERSRTVTIEDIETTRVDRWAGSMPGASAGPVPADIAARLQRYMNVGIA